MAFVPLNQAAGQSQPGPLYVDEVNSFDDHLVDVLLDSARPAEHRGTGGCLGAPPRPFCADWFRNPEEGELRPQLLDRFGMSVRCALCVTPNCASRWWISARHSTRIRSIQCGC